MVKRGSNLYCKILILVSIFLCLISAISAATPVTNATTRGEAELCLNDSQVIMNQMISSGFNVLRVNDSLKQAQLLYNSQVVLLDKKMRYDFSPVITYCNEIKTIRELSISARDEFNALVVFYNDSVVPGMNTQSIDLLMNETRDEIKNERYEKVKPLVDSAYNEIINVKSSYTAVNIFIDSTTKSFSKFFMKNWKSISTILVILIILFLVYRLRIMKYLLSRQIQNLELRKKTIKELIMKTQKDYFEFGKISEGEYNIKTKKFAELVRDIDRQIPLLREELVRLERTKVKKI